jgi:hypothetical protein
MVKRRHKPISPSEIITIADQQRPKKVGPPQRLRSWLSRDAYTMYCRNVSIAGGLCDHSMDLMWLQCASYSADLVGFKHSATRSCSAFRSLAHVPDGDRDKNDGDNDGGAADPCWYRIPHPAPPFMQLDGIRITR